MLVSTRISSSDLVGHLAALDAAAVTGLVERAVTGGASVGSVGHELLDAWHTLSDDGDDTDAAGVAAAAAVARRALARASLLADRAEPRAGRGAVVVVTSSSGADLFGAEVVAEAVADAGWRADVLSAIGGDGLDAHLRANRPAAVVVAIGEVTDLARAAAAIGVAHREGVPVAAWGRAFGPDETRAARLGADRWAPEAAAVPDALAAWELQAPALGGEFVPPAGYLRLEEDRPTLLSATVNIGGVEQGSSDWAQRTARTVVTHLAAAVLVEDSRILADRLEVERSNLRRKDLLEVHLLGLVDALAGALPEDADPARAYVLESREHLRRRLLSARPPRALDEEGGRRPLRSLGGAETPAPEGPAAEADPARPPTEGAPPASAGQVFADILLLAALSCQAPVALVSVPQGNGQWSTLSYGFEQRDGLNDPALFDFVAARTEPVEIADLAAAPGLGGSPLSRAPHKLRWVYAVALRNSSGALLGVVAVADRWLRELSRRDQRAMLAAARQMTTHLVSLRRVPPAQAAPRAEWAPPTAPAPAPAPVPGRREGLPEGQQLLRSHEVAVLFDVTERTVINWAAAGKLPSLRTIGGHLRFRSEDVMELLAGRATRSAR